MGKKNKIKMKKEQIISAVIVAFGIVIAALVLTNPIKTEKTEPSNEAYKTAFMSGCLNDPAYYGFCNCAYEKLEAKFGIPRLVEIGQEYNRTGVMPQSVYPVMLECVDRLK